MKDHWFKDNQKQAFQFLLSVFIGTFFFCILISLFSRVTNLFFIQTTFHSEIIIVSFVFSLLLMIYVNKLLSRMAYGLDLHILRHQSILFLIIINLFFSTLEIRNIPRQEIPVNHELVITVLPTQGLYDSKIQITKITRHLNVPVAENMDVGLENLNIEFGDYELYKNRLFLGENAIVRYRSSFSGNISIFFKTTSASRLVKVQFDQIERQFDLFSTRKKEVEIKLTAPVSLERLSLKWKIFYLGLCLCDHFTIFFILSVLEFIIFSCFFWKSKISESYCNVLSRFLFIGMTIPAIFAQIYQIWIFPNTLNSNLPPLKPIAISEEVNFRNIYQNADHTKNFASAFILSFMDIFPDLNKVYIDPITYQLFNFDSFQFKRWFSVYYPQTSENMPLKITDIEINLIIGSEAWQSINFVVPEPKECIYSIKYLNQKPNEYILIVHRNNNLFLIPDTIINTIEEYR